MPKYINIWKYSWSNSKTGLSAIFDIAFTWKARRTMESSRKRKYMFKLFVAVIWTVVLPVLYASTRRNYTCYSTHYKSWLGELCFSSYMVAVTIYLMTNAIELVLFFVPTIGKYIEISNWRICTMLSWWTQVESHKDIRKYRRHFFPLLC